ncbi:MAG: hypothetical protein AAFV53_14410 [Myxococcota bacterium]
MADVTEVDRLWQEKWPQIVARAWDDEGFRNLLVNDTVNTLKAQGLPVMEGMVYEVQPGNATGVVRLPFPEKPEGFDGDSIAAMGDDDSSEFSDTSCCY